VAIACSTRSLTDRARTAPVLLFERQLPASDHNYCLSFRSKNSQLKVSRKKLKMGKMLSPARNSRYKFDVDLIFKQKWLTRCSG